MKKILKVIFSIFIAFILIGVGGMAFLTRGLESGGKVEIKDVSKTSLADGTYSGKYSEGRWSNEVKVTIKGNKITQIDIVKDVTFPKEEWRVELFNRVIEKQSTNVDIVSGATVTSKAYLKAIENALKK